MERDTNSITQPKQRRVLMIACAFPPTGGSGVQRSVKFAKYLPQFGWLPTVWAADRLNGLPYDPTLVADVPPEVTVHRQRHDGTLRRLQYATCGLTHNDGIISKLKRGFGWRLEAWLAQSSVPDESARWARISVRPLVRLIRQQRIDVLYSTLSPASNHLLALALKRRTSLPWVADFRDLWTDDYRYCERSKKRRAAHRRLEQEILATADVVIGVTDRQTAILAAHVPKLRHKFVTITNGFDPDDFPEDGTEVRRERGRFALSYIGRFDRWRIDDEWWAGLRQFAARLGPDRKRFLVRMIGHATEAKLEKLCATGLEYAFTGYVSHAEAVREMRSADALLLAVQTGRNADSVIPGKLFEYLAARRPILVVGPEGGECARIVKSCEAGLTVTADTTAICQALGTFYDRWKAGQPVSGCKESRLQPFSRVALTRRLALAFDRLVERDAPERRRDDELAELCVT